jgi:hypothetical protein
VTVEKVPVKTAAALVAEWEAKTAARAKTQPAPANQASAEEAKRVQAETAAPARLPVPPAAVAPTPEGWRGTLGEALAESERAAGGKRVRFVTGDWETAASVRLRTGAELAATAKRFGDAERIYSVTSAGAVQNTRTGRDVYVRVVEGEPVANPELQKAMVREFGKGPPLTEAERREAVRQQIRERDAREAADKGPGMDI